MTSAFTCISRSGVAKTISRTSFNRGGLEQHIYACRVLIFFVTPSISLPPARAETYHLTGALGYLALVFPSILFAYYELWSLGILQELIYGPPLWLRMKFIEHSQPIQHCVYGLFRGRVKFPKSSSDN